MKPVIWKALSALVIALFLALFVVGLVGECGGTIETATGGAVPMKCHWAFLALSFVAPLGILSGILTLGSSQRGSRRVAAIMDVAVAVICGLLPSGLGIGVCNNAEMSCNPFAMATIVLALAAIVVAFILVAKAAPPSENMPKRKL